MVKRVTTPLTEEAIADLHAGEEVLISGIIYTARDAAHGRMVAALKEGKPLPVDLKGQIIYYVGPTPPRPGQVIGSAGPTTSARMDPLTPPLLAAGLKGIVGKGGRDAEVAAALVKHKAVYFGAIGGSGALLSKHIKAMQVVAYGDLGTEAIRKLTVEDLPVMVVNDMYGVDLLEKGKQEWRREAKV